MVEINLKRVKMNKQDILNYLTAQQSYFSKQFGIRFIGIFGSFSRSEETQNSDIDILYVIEKDKKLSMFQYLKVNQLLEDFFHKKIDLVREETLKPTIKEFVYKDLIYV